MNEYYILKGKKAVPVVDFMTWARWFKEADRTVAKSSKGDMRVSTVFLGLDHQWGNGSPLLFETMIFGGEHDQYQERCATWEEAEAMHANACELTGIKS